MSDKYQHINTAQVLDILKGEGFEVEGKTSVAGVRDKTREGFQKHLTVLKPTFDIPLGTGRGARILLQNAHDGSSSFRLYAGILEFACANGLVLGQFSVEVRVRHIGFTAQKVKDALKEVVSSFETQKDIVRQMQNFNPSMLEVQRIAKEIARERITKREGAYDYTVTLPSLLEVHREEDEGYDLWTIFNVIQENVLREGFEYKFKKDKVKERFCWKQNKTIQYTVPVQHNRTTKEVKGLDQQRKLNKMIFEKCYSLIEAAA
jgi:hypothetical protein